MIINLDSYVSKIMVGDAEEQYEPKVATVELDSYVSELDVEEEYIPQDITIKLDSYSSKIASSFRIPARIEHKTVSLSSYVNKVTSSITTSTYYKPLFHRANVTHIENKTNVYHIE